MQIASKFKIEAAASDDATRAVLNSVYIDCRDPAQHLAVANNGRILVAVPVDDVQDCEPGKLIPPAAFKTARKLSGKHRPAYLVANGAVSFADGSTQPIPDSLKGAQYPNWRAVIPAADRKTTIKIAFQPQYLAAIAEAMGVLPGEAITLEIETAGKDYAGNPIRLTASKSPGAFAVMMPFRTGY